MKSICKNTFNCPVEATIQLIGGDGVKFFL